MADANLYAGITKGLSNVAQYQRERPIREARLSEARTRQQTAELELQTAQGTAHIKRETAELELERTKGQLKVEQGKRLQSGTFRAFDAYEGDGDVRHLNNFLTDAKQNPTGSMWQKWVRFDPLVRSPETEAMLAQAGIQDVDGYFGDPDLMKSKVIGIDGAGQQTLLDMDKLYQATGYMRFASSRRIAALNERAQLNTALKGTASAETNMIEKIQAENPGMGYLEATKKFYAAKNVGKVTGSALERIAEDLMAKDENLSYEDAISQASRLKAAPGSAEKNIKVTADVRQQIHDIAGGDFYSADLSDPKIRAKIGEKIVDLEQVTGKTLNAETKRVARKLRSMIDLGGIAGEKLTDEETGIMDNILHGLRKYFSDNIEGVEGTAAYSAMRNVTRNALMGATLTPKELSEFDKAAGTLKQQLGPVLAQLKVQLVDIKGQIESVMSFEDPMMAKYYLGMSQDQADAVVEQLDRRLELISGYGEKQQKFDELRVSPIPIAKPKVDAVVRWKELTNGS